MNWLDAHPDESAFGIGEPVDSTSVQLCLSNSAISGGPDWAFDAGMGLPTICQIPKQFSIGELPNELFEAAHSPSSDGHLGFGRNQALHAP